MENLEDANARLTRHLIEANKKNKILEYDIQQLQTRISKDQATIIAYTREIEILQGKLKNSQRLLRQRQILKNLD